MWEVLVFWGGWPGWVVGVVMIFRACFILNVLGARHVNSLCSLMDKALPS